MRSVMPRALEAGKWFHGAVAVLVLVCAAVLVPHPATAQVEIGTSVGATIVRAFGDTETHVGIPGGIGPLAAFSPVLYATIFAAPSVIVEPQVSVSATTGSGSTVTFVTFVGQIGYLFKPTETASPYVAACGAFQGASGGGSFGGPGVGGEIGYRVVVKSSLGFRVNGRYRRWFNDFDGTNEFGVGVALGAIL